MGLMDSARSLPARRSVVLASTALLAVALAAGCSDDEAGSAEELCAALRGGESFAGAFEGFDPTDTDPALEQLRAARVELGRLRELAPSEVRADVTVEIDYVQGLVDALEDAAPSDPTAAVGAVRRVTEEHPDVQQATDRLQAWTESTC
jgi:hypothetical protein